MDHNLPTTPPENNHMQLFLGITLIAILALAGTYFYFWHTANTLTPPPLPTQSAVTQPTTTARKVMPSATPIPLTHYEDTLNKYAFDYMINGDLDKCAKPNCHLLKTYGIYIEVTTEKDPSKYIASLCSRTVGTAIISCSPTAVTKEAFTNTQGSVGTKFTRTIETVELGSKEVNQDFVYGFPLETDAISMVIFYSENPDYFDQVTRIANTFTLLK